MIKNKYSFSFTDYRLIYKDGSISKASLGGWKKIPLNNTYVDGVLPIVLLWLIENALQVRF